MPLDDAVEGLSLHTIAGAEYDIQLEPHAMADRKRCFLITPFGKKTDPESGRVLDFDATRREIIEPACEIADVALVRIDEFASESGIERTPFRSLLESDIVVADISLGNPDVMYELGVRHALRTSGTIIISEDKSPIPPSLHLLNVLRYEHRPGEKTVAQAKLADRIKRLIDQPPHVDSLVYDALAELRPPRLNSQCRPRARLRNFLERARDPDSIRRLDTNWM